MNLFAKRISDLLNINIKYVDNTLELLDSGCTIPFISRYRKERTGGLDEVQITQIYELNERMKETAKRKETIIKTISELGKLTPELESVLTNVGSRKCLRTSTCPTSRNGAQGPRWQGRTASNRWQQ